MLFFEVPVTFLTASALLTERGIAAESYMVAVAAAMEGAIA